LRSQFEGVVPTVFELRERARRARWLASQLSSDRDRKRLLKYAEEIEAEADALERQEKHPKEDG
jgi:hypothetical protein